MVKVITNLLDYQFNNPALLEEALTHPSMSKEREAKIVGRVANYERLEFLGDAVLGLVITEFLLSEYPDEREGALAKRRAALVCGETLALIANQLNLGKHIIMTVGENNSGGRNNVTNLENSLEAIIGALYLDGGLEISREFILKYWLPVAKSIITPPKDPKTSLQEWAQKSGKPIPEYTTVDCQGPSHSPLFTVEVKIEGFEPESASSSSKRKAERIAAEIMLNKIISEESHG